MKRSKGTRRQGGTGRDPYSPIPLFPSTPTSTMSSPPLDFPSSSAAGNDHSSQAGGRTPTAANNGTSLPLLFHTEPHPVRTPSQGSHRQCHPRSTSPPPRHAVPSRPPRPASDSEQRRRKTRSWAEPPPPRGRVSCLVIPVSVREEVQAPPRGSSRCFSLGRLG